MSTVKVGRDGLSGSGLSMVDWVTGRLCNGLYGVQNPYVGRGVVEQQAIEKQKVNAGKSGERQVPC